MPVSWQISFWFRLWFSDSSSLTRISSDSSIHLFCHLVSLVIFSIFTAGFFEIEFRQISWVGSRRIFSPSASNSYDLYIKLVASEGLAMLCLLMQHVSINMYWCPCDAARSINAWNPYLHPLWLHLCRRSKSNFEISITFQALNPSANQVMCFERPAKASTTLFEATG